MADVSVKKMVEIVLKMGVRKNKASIYGTGTGKRGRCVTRYLKLGRFQAILLERQSRQAVPNV